MALSQEDLQLWKRRYKADCDAQAIYHPRWKRAIRLFDTSFWDEYKAANKEIVEVNYSTTFITTLVSAVFARNPEWRVEAKRPGRFYEFANTMQVLLSQFNHEAKLKELGIRCVVDAATCNIGWIEQGFFPSSSQTIPQPETGQDQPGLIRRMEGLLTQLSGNEVPDSAQQGILEPQQHPGEFFTMRRSPWDVIVPAGCYEYSSMPYLIVRDRMTYGDFLARTDLMNQDRFGLVMAPQMKKIGETRSSPYPALASYNPKSPGDFYRRNPDVPIELLTVWDRREQQVFTFSEMSDMEHRAPVEWPYFAQGFPQRPLQFNYVPEIPDERDNFYGFSDLDPIEAQVLEKSDLRTHQAKIRRRAMVKVFVQEGSATESRLQKLQSPDIEIVPVANVTQIVVSQPIQMPPAVLQYEDRIDSDLSRDSNMSLLLADASQLGKIDRATVANYAQQGTSSKSSYKVDRIESWIGDIGRYRVGLLWQFLSAGEVAERLGHEPSEREWVALPENPSLAKAWIRNELILSVMGGSTKPLNVDVLAQDQFMKQVAVIQQVDPLLFSQISRQVIAQMMKMANQPALEAIVLAALDPQEEQAAQMENQLMAQGMPQVVGPHDDHDTHETIHAQAQQTPIVLAHRQAHLVRKQELAGAQKTAGQGVRQSSAAPSAAEINQGGSPKAIDLQGASMNQGAGTRSMAQAGA